MFDSLQGVLNAMESKMPIVALQRDALVRENAGALKAASTADRNKLPNALANAEQLLGKLEKLDGGSKANDFKSDISAINRAVNPANDHAHQYLPFLQVLGVNDKGHIQVADVTDGKTETLVDNHNLLEPTAPPVGSDRDQLYIGTSQKDDWKDAIKPGDVQQGRLGDCYFLATLQSVAAKDPQSIRNMIRDNGTGADGTHTYTVTFPGAEGNPVTISKPNIYDVSVTAQDASGLWANVLEKAHRELTGKNMHDDGGDPLDAFKLLTGKDALPINLNKSSISQNLAGTLSAINDREATVSTTRNSTVIDAAGNTVEVIAPHAYSLVGYNAKTNMVTLSNPQDLNSVDGAYRPELANVHKLNQFDKLLQKTEPAVMNQPMTGRLVTMSLANFASSFDELELATNR